jgi:hypothetical protein
MVAESASNGNRAGGPEPVTEGSTVVTVTQPDRLPWIVVTVAAQEAVVDEALGQQSDTIRIDPAEGGPEHVAPTNEEAGVAAGPAEAPVSALEPTAPERQDAPDQVSLHALLYIRSAKRLSRKPGPIRRFLTWIFSRVGRGK